VEETDSKRQPADGIKDKLNQMEWAWDDRKSQFISSNGF
jgi:hypothetical protein